MGGLDRVEVTALTNTLNNEPELVTTRPSFLADEGSCMVVGMLVFPYGGPIYVVFKKIVIDSFLFYFLNKINLPSIYDTHTATWGPMV